MIITGVVGLVVVLAAIGGTMYASDFAIEATVVDTECGFLGGTREITVKTKLFGIEHTLEDVPEEQCTTVREGNFAVYHIRSGHTTLYDREGGNCLYDSETVVC